MIPRAKRSGARGMPEIMKKKIIISIIIILILIAGGFFWWWQNQEVKGSPEDYVIIESKEGKIVENKKAGLTVKAPEGWIEKRIEAGEGGAMFYSPDSEIEWRENLIVPPIKQGCVIRVTVVYKKMDFNQIKKEVSYNHFTFGKIFEEFKEITTNNYTALKCTFETQDLGPGIEVYIPKKNKLYGFFLTWGSDEKEKCIQEFNKFLETVSIK
jgi:hypothetical protein